MALDVDYNFNRVIKIPSSIPQISNLVTYFSRIILMRGDINECAECHNGAAKSRMLYQEARKTEDAYTNV